MKLHTLSKAAGAKHRRKRLGHGMGSGVGKTCGKGHKGQMARKGATHKAGFEGGQMTLIRRLPKRGFKNPVRINYIAVNVGDLNAFDAGGDVTPAALAAAGLIKGECDGVKILGQGELDRKLTVAANAFSASARAKIEAVGGTCNVI